MTVSKLVEMQLHLLALQGEVPPGALPRVQLLMALLADALEAACLHRQMPALIKRGMTPAQLEILPLLARGADVAAMAEELGVGVDSVRRRLAGLRKVAKVGPHHDELVRWASGLAGRA